VIARPSLGTSPGMAVLLGPIVFVVIVVGGLGSLIGAFVASLLIGMLTTFAVAIDYSFAQFFVHLGLNMDPDGVFSDLYTVTIAQLGPIMPYMLLVLILIFRPTGLFGTREV